MTTATNNTAANQVSITAFLSEDAPGDNQTSFLCTLDESGQIQKAERHAYTITTLYHGSHRAGDDDTYPDFESAYDAFETYVSEDEDADADDLPTPEDALALIEKGEDVEVRCGTQPSGFGIYYCLTKATTEEPLVDAPIYEDADGREISICHEDASNMFVVQVKNLNGTFSVCSLDGETYSAARSWQILDRVPEAVREDVEATWEVSA